MNNLSILGTGTTHLLSGLWGGHRFGSGVPFLFRFESKTSNRREPKNPKVMNLDKSREVFCVQGFEILEGRCGGIRRKAEKAKNLKLCNSVNRSAGLLERVKGSPIMQGLDKNLRSVKNPIGGQITATRQTPASAPLMSKARAGRTRLADIRLERITSCARCNINDLLSFINDKGRETEQGLRMPRQEPKFSRIKTVAFPVLWCFHAHRGSKGYMNLSTKQPDLGRGEHPRDSIAVSITPIGRWKSLSEFSGKGSSVHTSSLRKLL